MATAAKFGLIAVAALAGAELPLKVDRQDYFRRRLLTHNPRRCQSQGWLFVGGINRQTKSGFATQPEGRHDAGQILRQRIEPARTQQAGHRHRRITSQRLFQRAGIAPTARHLRVRPCPRFRQIRELTVGPGRRFDFEHRQRQITIDTEGDAFLLPHDDQAEPGA